MFCPRVFVVGESVEGRCFYLFRDGGVDFVMKVQLHGRSRKTIDTT
jgi:hypothetical protein